MIRWVAYINDGVEISSPEGCKTKAEAIKDCIEDRELVIRESGDGSDMGMQYYVEKQEITDDSITVLAEYPVKFKRKK